MTFLLVALTLAACDDATVVDETGTTSETGGPQDTGPFDTDSDGVQDALDCAPEDASVYPGATEVWYDGIDQDCDGNDNDADTDGYPWEGVPGGDDCDDSDPAIHPGAAEVWYDGIDQDCAGFDDEDDRDLDGFPVWEDCDDAHPFVYPGAEEWCDPTDHDCDGDPLPAGVCATIQTTENLWVMTMESDDPEAGFAFAGAQFLGDMDGDGDEELIASCYHCLQQDGSESDIVLTLLDSGVLGWGLMREQEQSATFESPKSRYDSWSTLPGHSGDWNGDGIADLILKGGGDHMQSGGAYLAILDDPIGSYTVGSGVLTESSTWFEDWDHSFLGWDRGQGGDYNGDGLDDVLYVDLGPWNGKTGPSEPHAHLLPGRTGAEGEQAPADEPQVIPPSLDRYMQGGRFMGDLDGDGLDEVYFTSHYTMYLVRGPDLPTEPGDAFALEDIASEAWPAYTNCMEGVGDIDGDGLDDWVIGSSMFEDEYWAQGAVWTVIEPLHDRAGGELAFRTEWEFPVENYMMGTYEGNGLGRECYLGDIDGDGARDVVASRGSDEGELIYTLIPGNSLLSGPAAIISDHVDYAGVHIFDIGDYDGDGYEDILHGRTYTDNPDFNGLAVLPGWDIPWFDPSYW